MAQHDGLVETLEALAGRPVVNDVLRERYIVPTAEWSTGDIEAMRAALRDKLGIDLRLDPRELQIAVFRPAR